MLGPDAAVVSPLDVVSSFAASATLLRRLLLVLPVLVASLRKLPDGGRDILFWRLGCDLGQKHQDFALGLVRRASQELVAIGLVHFVKMWCEYSDAAQMKTAILEHRQKHGIVTRRTSRRDPNIGFCV